jgi:thioredoxin 1
MSSAIDLTNELFEEKSKSFKGIILIDFWAVWCGPCRIMEPILDDQIVPHFPNITFYKVNVDEQPELTGKFGVTSIPTFHLLHLKGDGTYEKLTHFIGVQDAFNMKLAIENAIKSVSTSDQNITEESSVATEGLAAEQESAI